MSKPSMKKLLEIINLVNTVYEENGNTWYIKLVQSM